MLDFRAHTNILLKLKTICLGRLTWFTLARAGKIGCVLAADQTYYLDFHLWGLTQRTVLMAPSSIRCKIHWVAARFLTLPLFWSPRFAFGKTYVIWKNPFAGAYALTLVLTSNAEKYNQLVEAHDSTKFKLYLGVESTWKFSFSSVYLCIPTNHRILNQEYRDRKRRP